MVAVTAAAVRKFKGNLWRKEGGNGGVMGDVVVKEDGSLSSNDSNTLDCFHEIVWEDGSVFPIDDGGVVNAVRLCTFPCISGVVLKPCVTDAQMATIPKVKTDVGVMPCAQLLSVVLQMICSKRWRNCEGRIVFSVG